MGSLHSHAQSMRRSRRAVGNGERRCAKELLDVAQRRGEDAKGGGARRALFCGCGGRHHPARRGSGGLKMGRCILALNVRIIPSCIRAAGPRSHSALVYTSLPVGDTTLACLYGSPA